MAKGIKILILKKARLQLWKESKNLKETSKTLERSKTVIRNYLKSPNN